MKTKHTTTENPKTEEIKTDKNQLIRLMKTL